MEPLLSSEELDALRQTESMSGAPQRDVRPVDLVACDHRAFALLPQLQATSGRLARLVETLVARELRAPCRAEEQAVEIVPGGQLRDLWGRPRFVYGMVLDGQRDGAVLAIDGLLGGSFVNRQFGGDVDALPPLDRPPTATERRTVARLASMLKNALIDALRPLAPVQATLELDGQELPTGPAVVLMGIGVRVGEHSGRLAVAIDTACGCFEGRPTFRQPETSSGSAALRSALAGVGLEVCVVLGRRSVTMREFLSLTAGEVLALDTPVDGEVDVRVEGSRKFLGVPLLQHGNLSVQLKSAVKE